MITPTTDGLYQLHLEFFFDKCMKENGYTYEFVQINTGVMLNVKSEGVIICQHQSTLYDTRILIESFFINVSATLKSKLI